MALKKSDAEGAPQQLLPLRPHRSPARGGTPLDVCSAQAFALVGSLFGIPQPTSEEQGDILSALSALALEYGELVAKRRSDGE